MPSSSTTLQHVEQTQVEPSKMSLLRFHAADSQDCDRDGRPELASDASTRARDEHYDADDLCFRNLQDRVKPMSDDQGSLARPKDGAALASGVDKEVLMERMLVGQGQLRSRPTAKAVQGKQNRGSPKRPEPRHDQHHAEPAIAPSDEGSLATYLPLIFALCPAFFGIVFTNGDKAVTDILLLCIVAMYLHWLVKVPFDWYQEARVQMIKLESCPTASYDEPHIQASRTRAMRTLAQWELVSLAACFAGPGIGGAMLHYLRQSLTSSSAGSLISNFNITLFVLSACVRAVLVSIELIRRKTLRLQDAVHAQPRSRIESLEARLQFLETQLARVEAVVESSVVDAGEVRPVVDALARALRRHERNEVHKSRQLDEQLRELEREVTGCTARNRIGSVCQEHAASPWPSPMLSRKRHPLTQRLGALLSWAIQTPWRTASSVFRLTYWIYTKIGV